MEGGRAIRVVSALGAALAMLVPAGAHAATVHVAPAPASPHQCCRAFGHYTTSDTAAYYLAAPGERNDLTVTNARSPGQPVRVTFHDDGATVEPGEGCVSVDEHTARCRGVAVVQARLRDEDDTLHES